MRRVRRAYGVARAGVQRHDDGLGILLRSVVRYDDGDVRNRRAAADAHRAAVGRHAADGVVIVARCRTGEGIVQRDAPQRRGVQPNLDIPRPRVLVHGRRRIGEVHDGERCRPVIVGDGDGCRVDGCASERAGDRDRLVILWRIIVRWLQAERPGARIGAGGDADVEAGRGSREVNHVGSAGTGHRHGDGLVRAEASWPVHCGRHRDVVPTITLGHTVGVHAQGDGRGRSIVVNDRYRYRIDGDALVIPIRRLRRVGNGGCAAVPWVVDVVVHAGDRDGLRRVPVLRGEGEGGGGPGRAAGSAYQRRGGVARGNSDGYIVGGFALQHHIVGIGAAGLSHAGVGRAAGLRDRYAVGDAHPEQRGHAVETPRFGSIHGSMGDRVIVVLQEESPDDVPVIGIIAAEGDAAVILRAVRFAAGEDVDAAPLLAAVFRGEVPGRPSVFGDIYSIKEIMVVVGDFLTVEPIDRGAQ